VKTEMVKAAGAVVDACRKSGDVEEVLRSMQTLLGVVRDRWRVPVLLRRRREVRTLDHVLSDGVREDAVQALLALLYGTATDDVRILEPRGPDKGIAVCMACGLVGKCDELKAGGWPGGENVKLPKLKLVCKDSWFCERCACELMQDREEWR